MKYCPCKKQPQWCQLHARAGTFCVCGIRRDRCRTHADDAKVVIARLMLFNSVRNDAAHGRENDMSLDFLLKMFNGRDDHICPYCNTMMDLRPRRVAKNRSLTLQRKDNMLGHVKGNVVFCCHGCNSQRAERNVYLCAAELCASRVDVQGMRCVVH